VANPPYGKRLEKDGDDFERQLAETLKKNFSGWQAWLLTDNLKLESALRLKSGRRIPVYNGDIECRWMRFDMVSGSMRDKKPEVTPPSP
jgi:putative N6-adenine-specific DNA methylase